MAELIGGPLTDSLAEQSMGQQAFQTTPGEGMESLLGSVFQSLPTVGLTRGFTRDTTAREAVQNTGGPAVDPRTAGSDVDAMAAERGDGPDTTHVNPDDANKQAAAVGAKMTPFTAPVSKHALDSLIEDHLAEQKRQDVIDRSASTILNNPVSRFGVGALVSLADPLNIAAMMIPVAPEAFVAGKLAAASGIAGRTAIRAGVGAAQGAVGMAALEPLVAFNDYQEHTEWSAGEALRNVAFGALLGGAGHALLGGLADRLGRVDPETRNAALRAAVAQQMEGRPIDVEAILAKGEAEASTAPPPATGVPETEAVHRIFDTEAEAQQVIDRSGVEGVRVEPSPLPDAPGFWLVNEDGTPYATSTTTRTYGEPRSDAGPSARAMATREPPVNPELGPKPGLSEFPGSEADVWRDGDTVIRTLRRDYFPPDGDPVRPRSDSVLQPIEVNPATRTERLPFVEGIAPLDQFPPAAVDALRASLLRDGLVISDDRGANFAMHNGQLVVVDPGAVKPVPPIDRAGPSARAMATRALNPEPDPEVARATKANAATIERAPKLDDTPDKNAVEITKQAAELQARYDAEVAAGRLRDHPSIADIGKDIEDRGKAASDYAACFVSRGG